MRSYFPWTDSFKLLAVFSVFAIFVNCQTEEQQIENRSGFLEKIIPTNIRKIFSHDEKHKNKFEPYHDENHQHFPNYDYYNHDHHYHNRNPEENDKNKEKTPENRKEHGRLDSVGRDIIKGVSKGIDTIGTKLGLKSSSKGLDMNKSFFGGVADKFKEKIRVIVPGTKWCGDGDKAKNEDDFGRFEETDKCCRNHDNCPEFIASGEVKYGLENSGLFTRSHCNCDRQFYDCLKNVGSLVSKKIGVTYFSVLGPQCYKEMPCTRGEFCQRTGRGGFGVEYDWFDNPKF